MSVFNSISVGALIVLLVAGLLIGVFASESDVLNPQTSAAEANRMNMETSHQQAIYAQEERLIATETDAQIRTIEREQDLADAQATYNRGLLELDLKNKDRSMATFLQIAAWAGGALSMSLVIFTFFWAGSRAIARVKIAVTATKRNPITDTHPPGDIWMNDDYRKAKIAEARYKERSERQEEIIKEQDEQIQLMIRMQSVCDPSSLGKTNYDDLPLAG